MKGGKLPLGYTIVEVMIVLAVSGVMFVIAAGFVSGKQARAAFNQGVNGMTTDIQTAIESVNDGQYSDAPITCNVIGGLPRSLTFNGVGGLRQGTNANCTFIGQLLHFDVGGVKNSYERMPLAAAKNSSTGGPLTTILDSAITPITPPHGTVNLTRSLIVPQGLDVERMTVTLQNGTVGNYYNFAVVQGLGSAQAGNATLYASGAQTLGLYAVPAILSGTSSLTAASAINQSSVLPAKTVEICLTDGTRRAHITIGDNNNQLKATAQLGDASVDCP